MELRGALWLLLCPPSSSTQQQGIGEHSDRLGIPLLKGAANSPFAADLGFLLSLNAGIRIYLLTSKIRHGHSATDVRISEFGSPVTFRGSESVCLQACWCWLQIVSGC